MSYLTKPIKKKQSKMPLEKTVQLRIQKHLNGLSKCVCHRYSAGASGIKGHSDLYGTYKGKSFYFEVKRSHDSSYKATPMQLDFLKKQAECDALTGVIASTEEAFEILKAT